MRIKNSLIKKYIYWLIAIALVVAAFNLIFSSQIKVDEEFILDNSAMGKEIHTIAYVGDINAIEPIDADSFLEAYISSKIYDTLFIYNKASGVLSGSKLVADYTNLNNKIYEVQLDTDYRFHDGSRITAEDVKASIEDSIKSLILTSPDIAMLFSDLTGFNSFINSFNPEITGIEIINDNSIRFSLDRANSDFLYAFTFPETGIRLIANNGQNAPGTGDYKVVDWVGDHFFSLGEARENSVAKNRIEMILCKDIEEAVMEMELENADTLISYDDPTEVLEKISPDRMENLYNMAIGDYLMLELINIDTINDTAVKALKDSIAMKDDFNIIDEKYPNVAVVSEPVSAAPVTLEDVEEQEKEIKVGYVKNIDFSDILSRLENFAENQGSVMEKIVFDSEEQLEAAKNESTLDIVINESNIYKDTTRSTLETQFNSITLQRKLWVVSKMEIENLDVIFKQ